MANSHAVSSSAGLPLEAVGRPDQVRIVHLTDLHYGMGFNFDLWYNVSIIIQGLHPHAILVTGDLVNSPWWWRFSAIRKKLEELKTNTVNSDGSPPHMFVIPGNHDTRVYGILPIIWLYPIILLTIAAAVAGLWIGLLQSVFLALLALGIIALVLRAICLRKFTHYFRQLIPRLPTYLADLGLVLYPFDSATHAATAACGKIRLRDFVLAAKDPASNRAAAVYRIALVHHHVLPIPYDARQETMMVLKNAGAFLSEAAKQRIRLVLNGHKHHHHFSRVAINADTDQESEISVLATGTATAGKRPGPHGFNFSLVEIDRQTSARITRYRANGGAFRPDPAFWAESPDATGKALFGESARERECRCDSLAVTVDISPDGDVRRTNRCRGFIYLGSDHIDRVPGPITASVNCGHIERLRVTGEPGSGITPYLLPLEVNEPRRQRSSIGLSQKITCGHAPIDFSWRYDAPNNCAMSEQQFLRMHPGHKGEAIEWNGLTLRNIPVAEATILIKLPAEFRLDGEPWLSITDQDDRANQRLQDVYRAHLVFNSQTNIIFLRLPYPPLGLIYKINWQLRDEPPPQCKPGAKS